MKNRTSIVIPLGNGSNWDNNELRYCLRAVERYLINYGDIFIVGEKPHWIQNVIHIEATDIDDIKWKQWNIYNKVNIACADERVSDDFLFMNDDHILFSNFNTWTFPNYIKEDLEVFVERNENDDIYRTTLQNTIDYLQPRGYKINNYDNHSPIIYNKGLFSKLGDVDWGKEHGYGIKSLYGNINDLDHVFRTDLRIGHEGQNKARIRATTADKIMFSLPPTISNEMKECLFEMFPNKSKHEDHYNFNPNPQG